MAKEGALGYDILFLDLGAGYMGGGRGGAASERALTTELSVIKKVLFLGAAPPMAI